MLLQMDRYDFTEAELGSALYQYYLKSGYVFYVSHKGEFYVGESEDDTEVSRVGSLEDVIDYLD